MIAGLLGLTGLVASGHGAAADPAPPAAQAVAGPSAQLNAAPEQGPGSVLPPQVVRNGSALQAQTSTFNVTYTGFTPQAQAAFQAAVNVLQTVVVSTVPITVNASYAHLGGTTLGSAGPAAMFNSNAFPGLGLVPNSLYPVALINAKKGVDQCPNDGNSCKINNVPTPQDINASFSSDFPFYLGTDGNIPAGQYDLMSVVLHELVHGLGFLAGSYTVTASTATRVASAPFGYETFVERGNGTSVVSLGSGNAQLRQALISNDLFFDGPAADAANGGNRPKLYAPTSYDDGSTMGHLDEDTYGPNNRNALMTPTLGPQQAVHDPGPIVRGALTDIGWSVTKSLPSSTRIADFNGDGRTDLGVYRPGTRQWYVAGLSSIGFGATTDVPVPADYDGDHASDVAVFRPTGTWFIAGRDPVAFGAAGDIPVPADYDGDGDADVAVYRPSTGGWFIAGMPGATFGAATDIPVPADYDGDGDADLAVYRPSTGEWFIPGHSPVRFGGGADIPEPADYDGDGDADLAVFRPSTGQWFIAGLESPAFGTSGDIPVPGDYDGDGDVDVAVFRPSSGQWFVRGLLSTAFGANGDIPLPKRPTLTGGS